MAAQPFKRLFRWHALAIGCLIAAYLALMLPFGPMVYDLWTHGKLGSPHLLLSLVTVATAGDMFWTALQTPSIAVNHMRLTGRTFFVASCAGLVALGFLSRPFGIVTFGWVSAAVSALMIVAAWAEVQRVSGSLEARPAT